jgi:sugar O-acyltransferase (sialic acid O-acetyltransferase NeuD family)
MKNLIIIGAGGMGRSVYNIATESIGYGKDFTVKGFIDDDLSVLDRYNNYPPLIDSIDNYTIQDNDYFICSIGKVKTKRKIIERVEKRGGVFLSLIHSLAQISNNVKMGVGLIIARNAIIGPDVSLGDHIMIQSSAIIGHDSVIGDYSRIDCNVVCVGGTIVNNEVTLHTASTINHNVIIGEGAIVGAGSFVTRKVKENVTVHGNPAVQFRV